MRKFINSIIIIAVLTSAVLYAASGTPSTLVVRTDANNYLLVTSVTQTNPVTQGVFSSRTLRTDSSGSLQVILTGTVTPTYPMSIPASTCAAPSLGESGAVTTGIAFTATPSILMCVAAATIETITGSDVGLAGVTQTLTRLALTTTSTDGYIDQNTTAALVGTQVQISPRNRLSGRGWDADDVVSRTVSFFTEVLPVAGNTVSGTWKLGFIDPVSSAITYPLLVTSGGAGTFLGNVSVGNSSAFVITSNGTLAAGGGSGLLNLTDANQTSGVGFDVATDSIIKLKNRAFNTGAVLEFLEQTAPAAGAANTARIYAVDDGAGKTKLCVIFNTGAAQCFATQP